MAKFRFKRQASLERQKQVASLTKKMKTIIVDGQEVTVPVMTCPPPMECKDLLPEKNTKIFKMNRRRG